jgi:type IV pilus assembly protein PilW
MAATRTGRTLAMKTPSTRLGGFSIIELMVALTIGLIIVAAMLQNLAASSGSNRTNARVSEFQGNGRYAADFLRREIQHSGFAGVSWSNLTQLGATGTTDYGCGAGFAANIPEPIWGANDTNPFSGTCIPSANYARGDILVLRRAGLDAIPTTAALAANTLYFRSEYLQGSVFLGPTRPANLQTPVIDYVLQTDVYYISPWTVSASENPKVPALYRMTLGPGPAMTPQLVASDIENMQVQYGVSTTAGMRFYDASAVPASLWTSVVAVRLWLLARSTDAEPGYTNTSTYAMADQSITASDGFQRQAFPLVVQIRK